MTGPANSWQQQGDTREPFLTAGQQMEKLNMEEKRMTTREEDVERAAIAIAKASAGRFGVYSKFDWNNVSSINQAAYRLYAEAALTSLPPDDGLEKAAMWNDQRARDTPDAFETEFHQVSAAAIRALRSQPPQARAAMPSEVYTPVLRQRIFEALGDLLPPKVKHEVIDRLGDDGLDICCKTSTSEKAKP